MMTQEDVIKNIEKRVEELGENKTEEQVDKICKEEMQKYQKENNLIVFF